MILVCCQCGNNYFANPEKFDVLHTDPLVVSCLDCEEIIRMDCQGMTCKTCKFECEVKE